MHAENSPVSEHLGYYLATSTSAHFAIRDRTISLRCTDIELACMLSRQPDTFSKAEEYHLMPNASRYEVNVMQGSFSSSGMKQPHRYYIA